MKSILMALAIACALASTMFAQVPAGYYDSAEGKVGQPLRDALHDIIDNHTVIPHSSSGYDTHDALEELDEDPDNPLNVILVYSGYSVAKSTWPDWNREHAWPQSYGTDSGPARSDMFHLFACDANVNSSRGNKYFDNGGTGYHPEAPECRYDFDSWEVRDEEKGDLARSMFYLDVRYSGDAYGELDLELTDNTALIQSGSRYMGRLATLIEWHVQDPVDDKERTRNGFIYSNIQHNRNPFVDHPDWVFAIWGGALAADTWRISRSAASTVNFFIEAGMDHQDRHYLLLGSVSGAEPGTVLPGGLATLPLNRDWFTDWIIAKANSSRLVQFKGTLDAAGCGAARLETLGPLPSGVLPAGTVMHYAYALKAPFDYTSNAIAIEIEP
jgi:endonuclease I